MNTIELTSSSRGGYRAALVVATGAQECCALTSIGAGYMNRLVVACSFTVFGALAFSAFGCSPVNVGDPCIPEAEFAATSGAAIEDDLSIDVNSVQCETRVCLIHYFKGRVSCPYGNAGRGGQDTGGAKCREVPGKRNYFTIDGTDGGTLCCPQIGNLDEKPINLPVDAQCKGRQAKDAVYCSCRCDVPDDPEIDKGQVQLCKCPSGFSCVPLCDQKHGNCGVVPKGKWGSYCVKDGKLGAQYDPEKSAAILCGGDLPHP
jgi:hypothetical protein